MKAILIIVPKVQTGRTKHHTFKCFVSKQKLRLHLPLGLFSWHLKVLCCSKKVHMIRELLDLCLIDSCKYISLFSQQIKV